MDREQWTARKLRVEIDSENKNQKKTAPATCGNCTNFSKLFFVLRFNSAIPQFLLNVVMNFENTDQIWHLDENSERT